jgi:nucleoid-associated protein YgaU
MNDLDRPCRRAQHALGATRQTLFTAEPASLRRSSAREMPSIPTSQTQHRMFDPRAGGNSMGLIDDFFGKKRDDRNKQKADFSGLQGGSSSTAPQAAQPQEREVRTYTVVAGDTLSKIAKREYGEASKWPKIYDANRATIKNPDLIYPGQVLTLPADV